MHTPPASQVPRPALTRATALARRLGLDSRTLEECAARGQFDLRFVRLGKQGTRYVPTQQAEALVAAFETPDAATRG